MTVTELLEGVHWLGHASFRLDSPEGVIYIDPWKVTEGAPKADVILVTHQHHDHMSAEDIAKLRKDDTVIVGTSAVVEELPYEVTAIKAGDTVTVHGVVVKAVPAYNPSKQFHPREMGGVGYVVAAGGRSVYHAGDTDAIPELSGIEADVVLLPVGGKYTMTAAEAAEVANTMAPQVAVPMHWGDIIGSRSDAEAFRDAAQVPVAILEAE